MKKWWVMVLCVALVFALAGCGGDKKAAAPKTDAPKAKVLRVGHTLTDDSHYGVGLKKFAELARQYTNNNVNIQVYHSGVLGSDDKMLQAVQTGTLDFYIGVLTPLSSRVKEIQIWDLPFLFANTKEAYALLDGPSAKKIFEK